MKVKELIIGAHYWTVKDTQLVEVELVSHTGQDRPMNWHLLQYAISGSRTNKQKAISPRGRKLVPFNEHYSCSSRP